MDKANRNFDAVHATRDGYGNITAKNQNGTDADAVKRKPKHEQEFDVWQDTGDDNS